MSDSQGNSVDSSSPELPIATKHPLQNEWVFWYYKGEKSKPWTENLMEVAAFNTVEDFWALYNHLEIPSKLDTGCDYNVFKKGIKPMWEDSKNKNGGRIMLMFRKQPKCNPTKIDEIWLEILLCLIGEAFDEESDQICGAVINIRPKNDRISIWTTDHKQEDAIRKITQIIKQRANIGLPVSYELHSDGTNRTGGIYNM